MKKDIEFSNPILIDGKTVNKVECDTNEITALLFAEAETHKEAAGGSKGGNMAGAAELDYNLHLYLGFAGIIACNPKIAWEDLERIKGPELAEIMRVGRSFFSKPERSQEENLGKESEITQEPFTQAQANSKESE